MPVAEAGGAPEVIVEVDVEVSGFAPVAAKKNGFRKKYLFTSENILPREKIGRHTYSVVLKFFVERTDFTKSLMSTKKQLNIIVNKKQRT